MKERSYEQGWSRVEEWVASSLDWEPRLCPVLGRPTNEEGIADSLAWLPRFCWSLLRSAQLQGYPLLPPINSSTQVALREWCTSCISNPLALWTITGIKRGQVQQSILYNRRNTPEWFLNSYKFNWRRNPFNVDGIYFPFSDVSMLYKQVQSGLVDSYSLCTTNIISSV